MRRMVSVSWSWNENSGTIIPRPKRLPSDAFPPGARSRRSQKFPTLPQHSSSKRIILWKTGQLTTPGRRCDDCSIILPGSSIANILLAGTSVSSSATLGMFGSMTICRRPIRCRRRPGGLRSFDFSAAMFVFFAAATGAWLITPDFGFCNG
jgi:hypothetical protein